MSSYVITIHDSFNGYAVSLAELTSLDTKRMALSKNGSVYTLTLRKGEVAHLDTGTIILHKPIYIKSLLAPRTSDIEPIAPMFLEQLYHQCF
jgi:hypothetical protein